jgi:hypothetical protein
MCTPPYCAAQQTASLERLDVLGGAGKRHAEGRGKFADSTLAAGQRMQHLSAGGVRECVEDMVEEAGRGLLFSPALRFINHVVEYRICRKNCQPIGLLMSTSGRGMREWRFA